MPSSPCPQLGLVVCHHPWHYFVDSVMISTCQKRRRKWTGTNKPKNKESKLPKTIVVIYNTAVIRQYHGIWPQINASRQECQTRSKNLHQQESLLLTLSINCTNIDLGPLILPICPTVSLCSPQRSRTAPLVQHYLHHCPPNHHWKRGCRWHTPPVCH